MVVFRAVSGVSGESVAVTPGVLAATTRHEADVPLRKTALTSLANHGECGIPWNVFYCRDAIRQVAVQEAIHFSKMNCKQMVSVSGFAFFQDRFLRPGRD